MKSITPLIFWTYLVLSLWALYARCGGDSCSETEIYVTENETPFGGPAVSDETMTEKIIEEQDASVVNAISAEEIALRTELERLKKENVAWRTFAKTWIESDRPPRSSDPNTKWPKALVDLIFKEDNIFNALLAEGVLYGLDYFERPEDKTEVTLVTAALLREKHDKFPPLMMRLQRGINERRQEVRLSQTLDAFMKKYLVNDEEISEDLVKVVVKLLDEGAKSSDPDRLGHVLLNAGFKDSKVWGKVACRFPNREAKGQFLYRAIKKANLEAVVALVRYGAKIDVEKPVKFEAIHLQYNPINYTLLCISKKQAELEKVCPPIKGSPLDLAAQPKCNQIIQELTDLQTIESLLTSPSQISHFR